MKANHLISLLIYLLCFEIFHLALRPLNNSLSFYGGDTAEEMGFQTVLRPGTAAAGAGMESDSASMDAGALPESLSATSAEDTRKLAEWFLSEQVDLILFAGGDGTARDVYQAVELASPCVGIPAGVKIHSPVYAKNPRAAGRLALLWLSGKLSMTQEEEVLDIDEEQPELMLHSDTRNENFRASFLLIY